MGKSGHGAIAYLGACDHDGQYHVFECVRELCAGALVAELVQQAAQVLAVDGARVERNQQVVARLAQLRNRH